MPKIHEHIASQFVSLDWMCSWGAQIIWDPANAPRTCKSSIPHQRRGACKAFVRPWAPHNAFAPTCAGLQREQQFMRNYLLASTCGLKIDMLHGRDVAGTRWICVKIIDVNSLHWFDCKKLTFEAFRAETWPGQFGSSFGAIWEGGREGGRERGRPGLFCFVLFCFVLFFM